MKITTKPGFLNYWQNNRKRQGVGKPQGKGKQAPGKTQGGGKPRPYHTRPGSLFHLERVILFWAAAYVLCILISLAPQERLAGTDATSQLSIGMLLAKVGAWLPSDSYLSTSTLRPPSGAASVEFSLLIGLAFGIYGLCALLISQQTEENNSRTLQLIWLVSIVAGVILLLAPALLSRDIIVYGGDGRLLAVYHANPYFVTPSTYPHDLLYPLNGWTHYTFSYGPLWLVVCALIALVPIGQPLWYILAFRVVGLGAHLLNMLLVMVILRRMGRSPRIVALGTQLYGWNPLTLFESSNGGHNDVLMITFILVGVLLAVRADGKGLTSFRGYVLPIVALTLAALIKFTAVLLLILFILMLACRVLRPAMFAPLSLRENILLRWKKAFLTVFLASCISGMVALIFYAPFWIGHSISDIAQSFTSQPYSNGAHKSILDGILEGMRSNPLPTNGWIRELLDVVSNHQTWEFITAGTLICVLLIGAIELWKLPSIQRFVIVSLAALGAFLVVTPWFLPWYVTWLVALAVICLAVGQNRVERALLAFTLTFSASAFLLYLYNGNPVTGIWNPLGCLLTIGPAMLAFVIFVRSQGEPQGVTRGGF